MKDEMLESRAVVGGGSLKSSPVAQKISVQLKRFVQKKCRSQFIAPQFFGKKLALLKAFTLAEVLVTLTIIGVVSAMTIPTLHQRHTEQATIKKVQKFYSTMFQAYQRAVSEHGCDVGAYWV